MIKLKYHNLETWRKAVEFYFPKTEYWEEVGYINAKIPGTLTIYATWYKYGDGSGIIEVTDKIKKIDQWKEEIIPCILCADKTKMLGTQMCDPCRELYNRISFNINHAKEVLKLIESNKIN